jgi:iron complex outermembrane receptor protein
MELLVPVSKKLDLTFADRFDEFSDFGTTNNLKISFAYQPFDILKIRGAASTGFRAPSLIDEYQPNILGAAAGTMNGPGCPAGNGAIFTSSNCVSQGLTLSGGNPNLQPETSQNFDLGVILSPVRNLDVTVDYYRINVKNEIQTLPAPLIYANPTQYASYYHTNAAGTLSQSIAESVDCPTYHVATCGYIIQTSQNTGGIVTDGLDLSASYMANLADLGKVRLGLHSQYVMDYRLQTYTGGPQLNLDGRFNQGFQPVIRYQQVLTADWSHDKFGAGLVNHYLSKYQDFAPDGSGNIVNVGSYSIWNAYVSYKAFTGLKLVGGINNLFNTDPPFSNQNQNWQSGYNSVFSSPIGRAYYLRGTYTF